jgi:hypothetical protein
MVSMLRFPSIGVIVLSGVVAAVACSADGDDSELPTEPTGTGQGGSTSSGQGGLGVGVGGGTTTGQGCTSDLQAVVDQDGNVLMTCPPDQGCSGGMCVPACEAAANSQGSIGCEYWTPDPPFLQNETPGSSFHGSCYAVFVANTWGRDAKLTVKYDGNVLDVTSFARIPQGVAPNTQYNPLPSTGVPPGEVAVLFLSHLPTANHSLGGPLTCPITPAVTLDAAVHNSGRGKAFELVSDTPLTAHQIMPYGGARSFLPSASLIFPRTAWGDNYIAMAPHAPSGGQQWVFIVGSVDGTSVDVAPTTTLPGGTGVGAAPASAVTNFTINAGEIVQWLGADPTGAVFQADSPIGMWTGNTYLRVTSATSASGGGQDSAHQQLPPVNALGSEYVGAGIMTRQTSLQPESVVYRIMGVVDGTTLSWDPAAPAGAPTTLAAGELAEFESATLFHVSSQDDAHPFAMSHYMGGTNQNNLARPGCSPTPPFPGLGCGLGDEEWVIMLPPGQFLQRYAFFVDPTYATSNVVITRVRGASGFADVDIACMGTVTGWQPVGNSGAYEVAHVDLFRGGVGAQPGCDTSSHLASSDGAFGVTVWGTDYYASYGYPGGGNVGSINDVVVPPIPK